MTASVDSDKCRLFELIQFGKLGFWFEVYFDLSVLITPHLLDISVVES